MIRLLLVILRIPHVTFFHFTVQRMHLFVARFSDILDVQITCDGCDITLSGRRYRCLNCLDVDLCNTCYMCEYVVDVFFLEALKKY